MLSESEARPYVEELEKLCVDASYSAQAYFEAAKSAEFWDKIIVFIPSLLAAVASFSVAVGASRQWASVGAISGAVAATAAFVGVGKKAVSYKENGRHFTQLRHEAGLERSLALNGPDSAELERKVRALRQQYADAVSTSELISNRLFNRASKRIQSGILSTE